MSKSWDRTQMARVENYIACFGSITRAEAMQDLGIANLPAVISAIRKTGKDIITEDVRGLNRWGEKITYARYRFPMEVKKN